MSTYLDNAATSFPKPECVYEAVDRYQRNCGAAVGRGAYRGSLESMQIAERCRRRLAELLHAESPERIVFTANATDSLNLALQGLLRAGDHVVTSMAEHNSVLRPLRTLHDRRGVEISHAPVDSRGFVDPDAVRRAIRPNTRLVALVHGSNVTGAVQPIAAIAGIAHNAGVRVLVDAAQTAGHVPIDLRSLPIDLLACAGHKGLLGPQGTGVLYVRPGVEHDLQSARQGGTGTQSEDDQQPDALPSKYESGTLNAPGIAGLDAGVGWLLERGVESVAHHDQMLTRRLLAGLAEINSVRVWGPSADDDRVGVVSLTVEGFDVQDLSAILDQSFDIAARAGLHCAPGAHRALGTLACGGTLRMSVGHFTTAADIDAATEALAKIASS